MSVVVKLPDVLQRRIFTTTGCHKLKKGYYPMISVGSSALALSPAAKQLNSHGVHYNLEIVQFPILLGVSTLLKICSENVMVLALSNSA